MKIRLLKDIVKEIDGARRTLSAGKVFELRDPDAASLIANGYAEPFPSIGLVEGQSAKGEGAATNAPVAPPLEEAPALMTDDEASTEDTEDAPEETPRARRSR
ncbi:MAG: hypothetical protein IH587_09715 [Anaerolineae bacterium]|nr:hypothetical protein [Anaerolineae bacterium]